MIEIGEEVLSEFFLREPSARLQPLFKAFEVALAAAGRNFLDEVIDPFNARMANTLVPWSGPLCRRQHGRYSIRHGRHGERRRPLTQYLYLVLSDDGCEGRKSNSFLRHEGFRRIRDACVPEAVKQAASCRGCVSTSHTSGATPLQKLTEQGRQRIDELAQRYPVSADALILYCSS
jgi:hypothetical protein